MGYLCTASPNVATLKCKVRRSGVSPTQVVLHQGRSAAPPQATSAMPGDIFDCHGWGCGASGILWVAAGMPLNFRQCTGQLAATKSDTAQVEIRCSLTVVSTLARELSTNELRAGRPPPSR